MSKIYVPDTSYSCYVVQSEDTIRAYKETPRVDSDIEYRDYYIHSDYMYKDGVQTFSRYATLPICLDTSQITDEVYYRVDYSDILLMFFITCLFVFLLPLKIFVRLFRRFQ